MYARLVMQIGKDNGPPQILFRTKLIETWTAFNSLTVDAMLLRLLAGSTGSAEVARKKLAELQEELAEAKAAGAEYVEYAELTVKNNLASRRVIGHAQFTCALFNLGIVSERALVPVINQLMLAAHKAQQPQHLTEPVERVCMLINGCGDKLRRTPSGLQLMAKCRTALTRHMNGPICQSRIQFLIQDLCAVLDKWAKTQPELRGAPVAAGTQKKPGAKAAACRPTLSAGGPQNPQKQLKIKSPRVVNAAAASALRRLSSGGRTGASPQKKMWGDSDSDEDEIQTQTNPRRSAAIGGRNLFRTLSTMDSESPV
jgi:hypothetical protein